MTTYTLAFTDTAEEDLLSIVEYIALDNPTRAISFVEELTNSLRRTLSLFPYSGSVVEGLDLDCEVRSFNFGNYSSYYRVVEELKLVEVLFVFNGKQDIQALVNKDSSQ